MSDNSKKHDRATILGVAALATAAGHWWASSKAENRRKSRAEREDPNLTEEVCEQIRGLLDACQMPTGLDSEDDYRDVLAAYLDEQSDYRIEIAPASGFGRPDILVEGVLALEVKRNPDKGERDRCVGQCADYSRQWVTWVLLFETVPSRVQRLTNLLVDKDLHGIEVIEFVEQDDFEAEDEEDSDAEPMERDADEESEAYDGDCDEEPVTDEGNNDDEEEW